MGHALLSIQKLTHLFKGKKLRKDHRLKFEWLVHGWKDNPFMVVYFQGEEKLSQPYQFVVTLACQDQAIDLDKLLRAFCCLRIYQESGSSQNFHGILSDVQVLSNAYQQLYLQVTLVPQLWALSLGSQCQVFLSQSLPDILTAVLSDREKNGLCPPFMLKLMNHYEKKEFVLQYNESSLQFINRLMEQAGLYYYFEQQEKQELLIITDHKNSHQLPKGAKPLCYATTLAAGMVEQEQLLNQLMVKLGHLPDKVLFKGYDPHRPAHPVMAQTKIKRPSFFAKLCQFFTKGKRIVEVPEGLGQYYRYGEPFTQQRQGEQLMHQLTERLQYQAHYYQGESRVPWLTVGSLFAVEGHFLKILNQTYLLTQITHQGDQASELATPGLVTDKPRYSNAFTAIESSYQYRPLSMTPCPNIGFLRGIIDAVGSKEQAMLDPQGRYKVIFPFDLADKQAGKASHWLTLAQPFSGSKGGMHCPLCKGTEVIIAFFEGDPDRPFILSTIPNVDNPSVVNEKNAGVNKWCSRADNELCLDDTAGKQSITLSSKNNTITLGDIKFG